MQSRELQIRLKLMCQLEDTSVIYIYIYIYNIRLIGGNKCRKYKNIILLHLFKSMYVVS